MITLPAKTEIFALIQIHANSWDSWTCKIPSSLHSVQFNLSVVRWCFVRVCTGWEFHLFHLGNGLDFNEKVTDKFFCGRGPLNYVLEFDSGTI